jgi:hypothetical protein
MIKEVWKGITHALAPSDAMERHVQGPSGTKYHQTNVIGPPNRGRNRMSPARASETH